ncbi:TetR family transcriptional regulator [Kocuria flava]|uniref:TetR family transcriptional regulator n=1 Tax=Kocuria flava TaxID=446860 RepID=A0A0U3GH47_9MICC|nr:TetR/AcrR family transcriptional regulator [Kocuria flava]ALU38691.1 TetR family transcriptional regulator [Kocuria flava]GEO92062.1 putative transcriptional regulator, TetR family protein [Kocuria flava]
MAPAAPPARGRGRPSRPVLSTERITDAAIRIVSTRGYRHLTMTGLARELEVSTSALYNHTPSKRDVLIRVQDRINDGIDCSGFGTLPWDRALELWARSYRDCYAEHTAMIPVMAVLPVADSPHTLRMYETVARGLAEAGFAGGTVVDVVVAVESFVFGSAYDATAPAEIFEPGDRAELAPVFTRSARARPADPRAAADRAFDVGLGAMLEGFRARLAAGRD